MSVQLNDARKSFLSVCWGEASRWGKKVSGKVGECSATCLEVSLKLAGLVVPGICVFKLAQAGIPGLVMDAVSIAKEAATIALLMGVGIAAVSVIAMSALFSLSTDDASHRCAGSGNSRTRPNPWVGMTGGEFWDSPKKLSEYELNKQRCIR